MDLEEAIEKAIEFLTKYAGYRFWQLLSATKVNDTWVLRFDVGITRPRIIIMRIDDKTGKVISFEEQQATRVS